MAKRHRLPSDDALHAGGEGGSLLRKLLWTGMAVGAAAIANAVIFYKTPPLTSQLEGGEVRYFPTPDGDVFYKKAGDGPPLLLVHGIGAGASSFEWRSVWDALAQKHTVYAIDLLGFGKSDKPPIVYSDATYINLLSDFAKQVMGVGDGKGEADVIATSLSAAYVIALSQRDPSLFHRLVLVCPTGIEELEKPITLASTLVRALLRTPVLGTSVYNAIASRASIRKYLATRIYADPTRVTDEVVDAYYTSAHQPGGDNALPSFVSGYLNANVAEAFKGVVDLPLIVWGAEAKQTPVSQAEAFLQANPNAKLEVIEGAGMLPHDENPEAFLTAVRPFLAGAPEGDEEEEEDEDAAAPAESAAVGASSGRRKRKKAD
jgi:pimeloyl-ACP methyl ester carboxylesterase